MHHAKTQLLTDTFEYAKGENKKRKATPRANDTKTRKPKAGTSPSGKAKARRPRLTEEQKRARNRTRAAKRLRKLKERGLCKDCPSKATEGRTRCSDCAEKHRRYSEQRNRARGVQPRHRSDDTKPSEPIRKEIAAQDAQAAGRTPKRVRSEAYKQKKRETQAQTRAERISLGLCVECGNPGIEGQTRCADCVLKHRASNRRTNKIEPRKPAKPSGEEKTTMAQKDNPEHGTFKLVAQVPGQVKISGPPRKRRAPRPRHNNVEQRRLPGVPASDDESKA